MPDAANDSHLPETDGDLQLDDNITGPTGPGQPLPAAFFPACWHSDDTRMSVLFAPFRSRSLNPLNYTTKLQFWQQLIRRYCDHKGSAQCTIAELREAFRRNDKRPYSLGTVLEEMVASGAARYAVDFLVEPQHTWRGWATKRVQSALAWPVQRVAASLWRSPAKSPQGAVGHAGAVASGGDSEQQQLVAWVLQEAVEAHARRLQADELVAGHVLSVEQLVALQHGRNQADGAAALSADGVRLAVHQLRCEQKASVRCVRGVMLVRIAGTTEAGQQPAELAELDVNVWSVQQSLAEQQAAVERLDEAEAEADRVCRELVREGKKGLARVQLRKRKLLAEKIKKESDKLHNLEALLHSIEESKQSAVVIGAYKLAADTLRQTHLESGVTAETIGDVMADVQEALDDHSEIVQEMGNGPRLNGALGADASADDAQLEAELDELVQADRLEEEQRERDLNASIERRLLQLNIDGFGDLSVDEKNEILGNSVTAMRKAREEAQGEADAAKLAATEKRMAAAGEAL